MKRPALGCDVCIAQTVQHFDVNMVADCVFCGEKFEKGIRSLHAFPKCPQGKSCWVKNMGLDGFVPTKKSRLCSDHFDKACFRIDNQTSYLKPGSAPTLFSTYKSACAYCKIHKFQAEKNRSFHRFPLQNEALLRDWLKQLGTEGFVPNSKSFLCSDHFDDSCFLDCGNNFLKNNAVPTIFVPGNREERKRPHTKVPPSSVIKRSKTDVQPAKSLLPGYDGSPANGFIETEFVCKEETTESSNSGCDGLLANGFIETDIGRKDEPAESLNLDYNGIPANGAIKTEITIEEQSTESSLSGYDIAPAIGFIKEEIDSSPNDSDNSTIDESTRRKSFPATFIEILHDHRYASTARPIKKKLHPERVRIKIRTPNLRNNDKKIRRTKKKILTLKNIANKMRVKKLLPESGLACLDSIAHTDVSQFLERYEKLAKRTKAQNFGIKKNSSNARRKNRFRSASNEFRFSKDEYPSALRSFATTLHFYSPKTYRFARRKFCNALPHPTTLRFWYSAIGGEPGFTSEIFRALEGKAFEARKLGKEMLVALLMDEIDVKTGLEISADGKVRGFVDIGDEMETDYSVPLAKRALVLMAVALDGSWKIPVAYFFINDIDSDAYSGIIFEGLIRLHDVGIKAVSVTLDGSAEHFATMRSLGASFEMSDHRPYFFHPVTRHNVYVVFDARHVLKLFRNCLEDSERLTDAEGNHIRWDFVESLARMRENEGPGAGNKGGSGTRAGYRETKIKFPGAARTLSSGVADAIEFRAAMPEFRGCNATVRFIRCIDRLYDFLNSRNAFGKNWKSPLRRSNEGFWRRSVLSEIEYLKGATDGSGVSMLKTRRKRAFVGMITAVSSVIAIFDLYVKPENSQLEYLPTYRLSEDNLELFFCAVRSFGERWTNPTCAEFVSAYKKLLSTCKMESVNGNVRSHDRTSIVTVASGSSERSIGDRYDTVVYGFMANIRAAKKYGLDDSGKSENGGNFFVEFNRLNGNLSERFYNFSKSFVARLSGWVVKELIDERSSIIQCEKCQNALLQETRTASEFEDIGVVRAEICGEPVFPSESVVRICLHTEKLFWHCLNEENCLPSTESNFSAVICCKVMREIFQPPCEIFSSLDEHVFDDPVDEPSHTYLLIKSVCTMYIKLRLSPVSEIASESIIGHKMRYMTRKII